MKLNQSDLTSDLHGTTLFKVHSHGSYYLYLSELSLLHQIPSFSGHPSWGHLKTGSCQYQAENTKQKVQRFNTKEQRHSSAQTSPSMIPISPQQICSQLLSPLKSISNVIVVIRIRYMQVSTTHHWAWTLTGHCCTYFSKILGCQPAYYYFKIQTWA